MDKESTQQVSTENSTELDTTSRNNLPKRQIVFILVLAITSLTALTFSALLLRQNNILKKQISESVKTSTTSVKTPDTSNLAGNITHSQVDSCSSESCLFVQEKGADIGTPEGFAKVQGYYYEYEANDWGASTTCTGFVVTGGNETLIAHFNDWIKSGNALNKMIDEKLVVNIDLVGLDEETKDLISSSKENGQVELGVIRMIPDGRGASTCSSVIDIVFAKEVPDKVY